MSRWYRAHVGLVTDAKLGEAALIAECSRALVIAAWHAILESCAEINDAGRYDTTPRRVAAILAEPIAKVEAVFAAFAALDMIAAGCVRSWTRRQFESDSSTERSRKHRDAKRSGKLDRAHAVETPVQRDETPMQRCATAPYSHSETETDSNPHSPSSGPANNSQIETVQFERFWQAMPTPNPAAKASAQTAFVRLDVPDRAQAVAAAARYASAFAAKPTTHPISPTRFLRERCFLGYGPPSAASGSAAVLVRLDTPQWRAWTAYRGKPAPINRDGGWHFPTEWPPSVEGERGAA